MKIRARDPGFKFPCLYGGGRHEAASRAYGPVATPHALPVGSDGKILSRQPGPVDMLKLRRAIVPALNALSLWGG